MKKLLLSGLVVIGLNAYDLNITSGWQLLGAKSDMNVEIFNSNSINSVWTYNKTLKKWFAYLPNNPQLLNNYSIIGKLSKIKDGEGFWIYAYNDIIINTQKQEEDNTTLNIDVNTSYFDAFIDGVNDVVLNDIANKEFYMYSDEKISNFKFDAEGKAVLDKFDGLWHLSYVNGMIVGINEYNDTQAYKILASDSDVLVLAGIESRYSGKFTDVWFVNNNSITPIDMQTISYPYKAYSCLTTEYKVFTSDKKIQTYNYNSSTDTYNKTDEKPFTFENGKIVVDKGEYKWTWEYNNTTITSISKYYDKYQMLKRIGNYDLWLDDRYHIVYYYDDNLKNKTWNDLINSDIVIYSMYKLAENGKVYVKNNNDFVINSDYEYKINSNLLTIVRHSYDSNFTYELDSTNGKVTNMDGHYRFINVYSNQPIIKTGY